VPHYFYACSGMANSAVELMAILANLAPVATSWRVLCANRSGFEGRGVVVHRSGSERARWGHWQWPVRGTVAGVAASRPRVLNSVGVVVAVRGVARQWQGRPHGVDSDGDGAAADLASWFDPV
jgi:hypothetical protein